MMLALEMKQGMPASLRRAAYNAPPTQRRNTLAGRCGYFLEILKVIEYLLVHGGLVIACRLSVVQRSTAQPTTDNLYAPRCRFRRRFPLIFSISWSM